MDEAREEHAVTAEGAPEPGSGPEDVPESDRVRNADELWRIEGSLSAVRSEVHHLKALDDRPLLERIAALEQDWLVELEGILPETLVQELHGLLDWWGSAEPSASELRIALAQLEGWLDGVIAGLGFVVVEPTEQ